MNVVLYMTLSDDRVITKGDDSLKDDYIMSNLIMTKHDEMEWVLCWFGFVFIVGVHMCCA